MGEVDSVMGSVMVDKDGTSFGFGRWFLLCGSEGVEGMACKGTMSVLPNPPSPRVVEDGRD